MPINETNLERYIRKGCESTEGRESVFRESIVSRLLMAMGWEDEDIELERPMTIASGRTIRADYVLTVNGTQVVIEAKPTTQPPELFYNELTSYMKQLEANYGFVYNGKKLALFARQPFPGWDTTPAILWECGNDIDVFEALSRENIPHGLEDFIRRSKQDATLDRTVNDKFEEIFNSTVRIIQSATDLQNEFISANLKITLETPRIKRTAPSSQFNDSSGATADQGTSPTSILKESLSTLPEGEVVICASSGKQDDEVGERWMLRYNAWRSVRMNRNPVYFALYQGFPHSQIRLFAKIREIRNSNDPSLATVNRIPQYGDGEDGKKTILLEPNSVKILLDPIDKASWGGIRNIRYTTLLKFIRARTLDDL